MSLFQVTPFLPPRREGVGGYALALARQLRSQSTETTFLLARPDGHTHDHFVVAPLALGALRGDVLVHYSNYGYDPNGCPSELVESLTAARGSGLISRLVVFFHEVHASSPPWRRAFWFSRRQKQLAAALARGADHVLTSLDLYADLLRGLGARQPVRVMAIPSTVGEPDPVPPVRERRPTLVVFGGAGNRSAVYRRLSGGLGEVLRAAGIEEIVDIGPEPEATPRQAAGLPVARRGALADEEVSTALLSCRMGALAYPPEFFGKSTVFAAFAAHGVPCLAVEPWRPTASCAPHLRPGDDLSADRLEATARAALAWYRPHGIEAHARLIARWLEQDR